MNLPGSLRQGLLLILDNSQQFVYLLVGEHFQPVYVAIRIQVLALSASYEVTLGFTKKLRGTQPVPCVSLLSSQMICDQNS